MYDTDAGTGCVPVLDTVLSDEEVPECGPPYRLFDCGALDPHWRYYPLITLSGNPLLDWYLQHDNYYTMVLPHVAPVDQTEHTLLEQPCVSLLLFASNDLEGGEYCHIMPEGEVVVPHTMTHVCVHARGSNVYQKALTRGHFIELQIYNK